MTDHTKRLVTAAEDAAGAEVDNVVEDFAKLSVQQFKVRSGPACFFLLSLLTNVSFNIQGPRDESTSSHPRFRKQADES